VALFADRLDAGRRLARRLGGYRRRENVLVLALPRGGVVIGFEIARALSAPLDIIIVRKLGFPGRPELAIGALAETGRVVLNEEVISLFDVPRSYVDREIAEQAKKITERAGLYRQGGPPVHVEGKTVILTDDGVATGSTMKAAIQTLKEEALLSLVVAVPLGPPQTVAELRAMADEVVCLESPPDFVAVGMHYGDFGEVSDREVVGLLARAREPAATESR